MFRVYQPFLSAIKWRQITDGDINIKSKEITTSQKFFILTLFWTGSGRTLYWMRGGQKALPG